MPYKIEHKGDQFCVVKADSGESVGCHPSEEKAKAQLRALYANVHESELSELSMYVVKATVKDGEMRIRMTSSDTGKDAYDEAMSVELFDDFIGRIKDGNLIPEQLNPDQKLTQKYDWEGGMPYISLSHYRAGSDGQNVPGEIRTIYRDGKVLKATGVLYDTPLGRAVFKSLQKDLVEKRDDKIRVSIGFLDLGHSHGGKYDFVRKSLVDKCPLCKEGVRDKIYKKGCLVHLALTRFPANPRTDVEVEKSMATKREDAESIVEDDEVVKGLDLRSTVEPEDVLVIKSEDTEEKSVTETPAPVAEDNSVSTASVTYATVPVNTATPVAGVQAEPTPVEKSFAALVERISTIKSQGLTGEQALSQIQADFDKVGEVIKAEFTPQPTAEELAAKQMESTLRSLLSEMLPQMLAQTVAPMQSEFKAEVESLKGELRAKSLTDSTPIRKEEPPVQRSLNPTLVQRVAIEKMAQKSVTGLKSVDQIAQESVWGRPQ